ncbi:hypothetical protein [Saccharospirillum alexandrii]|uniref:hypothetical protein n=1 Tax=Saccharospirillum alexandrii TaxID=2448477 RepID=UPI000FDC7BF2|nr:hypothetical protein [Saccharospirillum alexandrii]
MKTIHALSLLPLFIPCFAAAHEGHETGILTPTDPEVEADFDIVHARITSNGQSAHFHMAVSGVSGDTRAKATGSLAGSDVYSYVWPTNLSPSAVGFAADTGVLSLAVTAHPDFDDTPLFDENRDGHLNNDGDTWHSHWVVLAPHPQCPDGGLGVVDIPEGESPHLPATWPGLPILIDSPGWQPMFNEESLDIHVAFDSNVSLQNMQFDAVTAGLRVNQSVHEPLLCVTDVFDTAGSLELPGRINQ